MCIIFNAWPSIIENYRKSSAENSSKLNKFLHSEVNLLIQDIIPNDASALKYYNIYLIRESVVLVSKFCFLQLISILLANRFELVEVNTVEMFHHYSVKFQVL